MSFSRPLNSSELNTLRFLLNSNNAPDRTVDYPAAYRFVHSILTSDPSIANSTDPSIQRLLYFFPGAAEVNENGSVRPRC